jgi:DNA-directed RNA polymerase subunit RPC12/RpoP
LDGEIIVVDNINDFIKSLEKQFTEWEVIETVAAGGIKELQTASFACFYCGKEIDRSKTDGDIICSSCGKEAFSCSICMKHISYNEETVKDPNCGNLFHRRHIIEWLKVQGTCPLCKKRINEKSLKIFTRSNK